MAFTPREIIGDVLLEFWKREVQITVMNDTTVKGWVQAIDPITKSFILVNLNGDGFSKIFVPGVNIRLVTKTTNSAPPDRLLIHFDSILNKNKVTLSDEALEQRKQCLCDVLTQHRLPYVLKNERIIEVMNTAEIEPPYDEDSVSCTNEIILDKLTKIVQLSQQNV